MLSHQDANLTDDELRRIVSHSNDTEQFCREHSWDVYLTLAPTVFGSKWRQTIILSRPNQVDVYCICDGQMTAGEHASLFVWMEGVKAGLVK